MWTDTRGPHGSGTSRCMAWRSRPIVSCQSLGLFLDSRWQISGPFVLNRPLSVDSFIPEPVPNGRCFPSTVVDGVPSDATIALLGAR